jgi:hypothetical protein
MFFVMNIFLAILLSKFEGNEDIVSKPSETSNSSISHLKRRIRETMTVISTVKSSPSKNELAASEYKVAPDGDAANGDKKPAKEKTIVGEASSAMTSAGDHLVEGAEELVNDITEKVKRKPDADEDYSLYVFGKDSALRQWCEKITSNPKFDNSIIVVILISSVTLAIDDPKIHPDTSYMPALAALNVVFTIIFTIEMVLKIISNGFFLNGPTSYLCGGWNRLDFVIVMIALAEQSQIDMGGMGSALRTVRTIRVLRPIRMVSRKKELKLVVDALLTSIPQVVNVLIVCLLFFLIFSVIFVNLYKGLFQACGGSDGLPDMPSVGADIIEEPPQTWEEFSEVGQLFLQHYNPPVDDDFSDANNTCYARYYLGVDAADRKECKDPSQWYQQQRKFKEGSSDSSDYPPAADCVTSYDICDCLGLEWSATTYQNFDNVPEALGLLFEISTTEGWVDVMFAAADGTSIHMQPQTNINYSHVIYFITFMMLGAFLFMNLFVGVIIERFNQIRDEMQVSEGRSKIFMTPEQEEWSNTQQFILDKVKPKRKIRAVQDWAFKIAMHPSLDHFIMACIMLNSLVMGMAYHGMHENYKMMLTVLNFIFAIIFTSVLDQVVRHRVESVHPRRLEPVRFCHRDRHAPRHCAQVRGWG